jgi:RHS repeat-associated protein
VPAMPTITYTPDYEGRINSVSTPSPNQSPVSSTSYNYASQVLQVNFGSGNSDSFQYDQNTGLITQYAFNVGGQTEIGNLTWNGTGTLGQLAITDPFNSGDTQTCNYSHDDLMRLSQANCGSAWNQSFSYDAFGNIKATGSGLFQPTYSTTNSNRIIQIGSTNVTYDSDGNVLSDTMHTFTWDVYNLPASIDNVSTTTYDALGRVVERTNGSSITQVLYSPGGGKLAIMSGQTLNYGYVPLPAGAMAEYRSNGGFYYRNPDWQGSARLITQEDTPWVYSDVALSPFGFPYAISGSGDYSYTGMNQDTSAGLYDFPAREYEWQGRWPSPDPAGLAAVDPTNPQSWNRYAYALNNPLALTDPLGLDVFGNCDDGDPFCCDPFTGICGGCPLGGEFCPIGPFPGGGGGGGGASGSSGPTPISEPPVNVGVPDDLGPMNGPIWSEQVPIYGPSLNPYLIIENFALYGSTEFPACATPTVGVWFEGGIPCLSITSILDDRANALAHAINKTGVQSLNNPCTVAAWYAGSAGVGTVVAGAAQLPAAVEYASAEYPSLIHKALVWLSQWQRSFSTGRLGGTIALIKATPAACSELQ